MYISPVYDKYKQSKLLAIATCNYLPVYVGISVRFETKQDEVGRSLLLCKITNAIMIYHLITKTECKQLTGNNEFACVAANDQRPIRIPVWEY